MKKWYFLRRRIDEGDEPLSERAQTDVQDEVDREYGLFTETVARNRNTGTEAIAATEAAAFWAENAIPLLADEVGTFDDALNDLRAAVRGAAKPLAARSAAVQKQNQKPGPAKVASAAGSQAPEIPEGRIIEMTKTYQEIEREAMREAQALKFRGGSLPPLYAHGAANAPCTKEAAIARHYEANPEDYAAYRAQHNAKALVATLEAAGIRLASR